MATAKPKTAAPAAPAAHAAPAAPAAPEPETLLTDYVCVEPIKRDGKRLEPGAIVALAEDDPLVISGAVRAGMSGHAVEEVA